MSPHRRRPPLLWPPPLCDKGTPDDLRLLPLLSSPPLAPLFAHIGPAGCLSRKSHFVPQSPPRGHCTGLGCAGDEEVSCLRRGSWAETNMSIYLVRPAHYGVSRPCNPCHVFSSEHTNAITLENAQEGRDWRDEGSKIRDSDVRARFRL